MKTLLIGKLHQEAESLLESNTELQRLTTEQFQQQDSFPDIEAVVLRTFTPLQKQDLEKLPNLKYVTSCSVGVDNIDLTELKERNIELFHCPGTNSNSVAEHTVYLLMSLLRKSTPIAEIKNKTIGIIGFGHIGKLVAEKLSGMEAKVIAFDVIQQNPEVLEKLKTTMHSFEEVLKQADIVTIHVPLNKHTKGLINGSAFAMMKPNSFFINTSREEVIDETAFLNHYNKFRGIGLDVCSEQLKNTLQNSDKNTVITDHCAAQGEDSFKEQCLQPVALFLNKN